MKKLGIFIISIFIAVLLAGIYGILHDQVTYSISPEYFTVFKFEQFGFQDWGHNNPRFTVGLIGFLATWWVGLFIGIFQSLVGLIHKNHKLMFRYVFHSILITLAVAVLFGIIGFVIGYFDSGKGTDACCFPYSIVDKRSFLIVGSIHNFGYIGGEVGALVGITYQIIKRRASVIN